MHLKASRTVNCFGFCFLDISQNLKFAFLASDCNPPIYASLVAQLIEMGGLDNFLPGLAENLNPSDLYLPSSWDYRHELPYQPLCYDILNESYKGTENPSHMSMRTVHFEGSAMVCASF
jgi:hypothetical protein